MEVKKEYREKPKHVPSSTTGIRVVIYRNTKLGTGWSVIQEGDAMRWLRDSRLLGIVLIITAAVVYLVMMWGIMPLLWPYREHPLVWMLLAFLSGGHLEELF